MRRKKQIYRIDRKMYFLCKASNCVRFILITYKFNFVYENSKLRTHNSFLVINKNEELVLLNYNELSFFMTSKK